MLRPEDTNHTELRKEENVVSWIIRGGSILTGHYCNQSTPIGGGTLHDSQQHPLAGEKGLPFSTLLQSF